jgi:hypothetical protein
MEPVGENQLTECPKIAAALHQVMSAVSYVQKTGTNSFHGYKFAGEGALLAVLRPAMVEAGLMLLPSIQNVSPIDEYGNVSVLIDYTLVHKDGEVWPEKITAAGMGNDRAKNGTVGDKGVYKAITGANKYVLFKLFQIETGDDPEQVSDHDSGSDKPAPAPVKTKAASRPVYDRLSKANKECADKAAFDRLWSHKATLEAYTSLPDDWKSHLDEEKADKAAELDERAAVQSEDYNFDKIENGEVK